MFGFFLRFVRIVPIVLGAFSLLPLCADAQLSLFSAVDLARRNSASVRIAQADLAKAQASLDETRDAYVPSVSAGSGAGYSYGFLGGVPSVFNAQISSLVFSFSQPDYIRAARAGLHTAVLNLQDAEDQVELDCALDYLQLNTLTQELAALDEEQKYADRLSTIAQDRLTAGVESQIAATRAELTAAQTGLKRLDLQAQTTLLRKRLSDFTGLPEFAMQTESASIPKVAPGNEAPPVRRMANVDAAFSNAVSKHYVAHGDDRVNYRPQIGFGFRYDYLQTTLNNYNQFYAHPLQPNNFGIAAQITWPLFSAGTNAKARQSAADAVHADAQAVQGQQLAEQQAVQLKGSFPELRAQARIAELQARLAEEQLQAVLLQVSSLPTAPGAQPVTPADEMEARINERARFAEAVDARFVLLKAQLSLLRVSGGLRNWINLGVR